MVTSTVERIREEAAADQAQALTPAIFHILLALAKGKSHGYGIMRTVDGFTSGGMRLGPGTLYRSIQRMVVDGLIEELEIALHDEADDDRRRIYRLTKKGLAVARQEAQRLAVLVNVARASHLLPTRGARGARP